MSEKGNKTTGSTYPPKLKVGTSTSTGTPRKLLDVNKLKALGWEPDASLKEGIGKTYDWFLSNLDNIRE